MGKNKFICLGIETSCDETSASIVSQGCDIISNIVVSQESLHKIYGGVVPEIACRVHIESIIPVISQVLKRSGLKLSDIDAIAVTNTPGLVGALLVGVSVAKAFSLVLNKPIIGVNHLEAHLYAAQFEKNNIKRIKFPAIGLVASGGHSSLFLVRNNYSYTKIGGTIDDAAGEAFDKVAAILGLPYPGGPSIQKASFRGNSLAIKFHKGFAGDGSFDFSFSGLKTAVLYKAKGQNASKDTPLKKDINIPDIAASFQVTAVDTLIENVFKAVYRFKSKSIIMGGGVIANKCLRDKMVVRAEKENIPLLIPSIKLCTDNAAMIAGFAYHKWKLKKTDNLLMDVFPT
jgi:N6-L-threonylcarbamoyladenine synthase